MFPTDSAHSSLIIYLLPLQLYVKNKYQEAQFCVIFLTVILFQFVPLPHTDNCHLAHWAYVYNTYKSCSDFFHFERLSSNKEHGDLDQHKNQQSSFNSWAENSRKLQWRYIEYSSATQSILCPIPLALL
jgi:hypothetical protein